MHADWLGDAIQAVREVQVQFAKETFKRYRECGQIILQTGYRKGQWHSEHKQRFLRETGIGFTSFSQMVQLGEMPESEFFNAVEKFPSFHSWANEKTLASAETIKQFVEKDDFKGFCDFQGSEKKPESLTEKWRVAQAALKLQQALNTPKFPLTLAKPLIRKGVEPLVRKQVIEKLKTLPTVELTSKTVRNLVLEAEKPVVPAFEKRILEANKQPWTQRIHAPVSRMDEEVFTNLQRMGIPCEFQKEFCIRKTIPDIYIPSANLAVYLDGEAAHRNSELKDEITRDLLNRLGVRILSLKYGVFSPALAYSLACEIRDAVKQKETVKVKA